MEKTLPRPLKPEGIKLDPKDLVAGKYGTHEMVQIWGQEQTFDYLLRVQAESADVLSQLHPDIVPPEHAREIREKANLQSVHPDRIRELEKQGGHGIIALNTALEEQVSAAAKPQVHKFKTSADATEPARALQLSKALEVIIESVENLRDIAVERAIEWKNVPHMDCTHGYDAMPTVAGRPLVHYVEMLQSDLAMLRHVYDHSIMGKWSDATGNHHTATSARIDGMALEQAYCSRLGINHMIASAQLPGLEFQADIVFALARTAETLNNFAKYVAWGRSDDVNIFINARPRKQKGSSAMPHKDVKNGNPDVEEQCMSIRNYMHGWMITALNNCEVPYARNLAASANSRINFEDGFKFLDQGIRKFAEQVYWLKLNERRSEERVRRSYGVVTSSRVMTTLTDARTAKNPLGRSEAHDLVARCASEAWKQHRDFASVLAAEPQIAERLAPMVIQTLADPTEYIGQSKEIIDAVVERCYKVKTL